jgi:hypothetical protein
MAAAREWLTSLDITMPMQKRIEPWKDGGEVITYSMGQNHLEPPLRIALLVGDALSNYRAALDHLAWQLVTKDGTPPKPNQVYFPIGLDRLAFAADLRRKMPGVAPVTGSIVERYQPFQHGERARSHPLWILSEWVGVDKHRAVPLSVLYSTRVEATVPDGFPNFRVMAREGRAEPIEYLLPGTDLIRIYGKRIEPRKDPGALVRFGGQATIAHESGRTLEAVLDGVDRVVDAILGEFERMA